MNNDDDDFFDFTNAMDEFLPMQGYVSPAQTKASAVGRHSPVKGAVNITDFTEIGGNTGGLSLNTPDVSMFKPLSTAAGPTDAGMRTLTRTTTTTTTSTTFQPLNFPGKKIAPIKRGKEDALFCRNLDLLRKNKKYKYATLMKRLNYLKRKERRRYFENQPIKGIPESIDDKIKRKTDTIRLYRKHVMIMSEDLKKLERIQFQVSDRILQMKEELKTFTEMILEDDSDFDGEDDFCDSEARVSSSDNEGGDEGAAAAAVDSD